MQSDRREQNDGLRFRALRLINCGYSRARVARQLDVDEGTVAYWVDEAKQVASRVIRPAVFQRPPKTPMDHALEVHTATIVQLHKDLGIPEPRLP